MTKDTIISWLNGIWMKVKKPFIYFCLFLGLLLIAFFLGKCSTKKERSQQIANLAASRDSITASYIVINGLKYQVSARDAIILTKEEAIKVGLLEQERLKKLHLKEIVTNTELQGHIDILRDSIKLLPGTKIIRIKDSSGMGNYIKIPLTLFNERTKWLSLSVGLDSMAFSWYNLSVPITGTMTIGYMKTGFLKTKPVGIFTSENPYLMINQMDITIIQEKQKWFQKWWVHAIGGVVAFEGVKYILIK
jgi:hypothetical protein